MGRESVVPSVKLGLKPGHLLQGQLVGCGSRVVLLKNTCKNATRSEKSQGTGKTSVLARESGLEALLGDVLIVSVGGILGLDILFLEELRKSKNSGRETVEAVQSPEDLLPCLDSQGTEGEALLALVKSKTMRKTNRNTLVMLEALVICPHGAVEECKSEALEGVHSVLHKHGVERLAPLYLAGSKLGHVRGIRGETGNVEDEVELGELVIALDFLGIGHKLLIDAEEGRLVKNREQGSPLLEVDIDASIREQARRYPQRLVGGLGS